jgi:transposase
MGCGSGVTCWRRLREWQQAGVWQRLHELLLVKLHQAELIDWSRAAIDSSHVRAFGGRQDRPQPGRPLPKRLQAPPDRLRRGTPLACSLTGGNRNDITQLITLVDAIPPVRGRRGRPRRRPRNLYGDRAYRSRQGQRELRRRNIQPKIARPKRAHGSGLGSRRWVVERTIAWLHQYRRLRIRYERRRHPRSLPRHRLQPHLPQAARPGECILKGALRAQPARKARQGQKAPPELAARLGSRRHRGNRTHRAGRDRSHRRDRPDRTGRDRRFDRLRVDLGDRRSRSRPSPASSQVRSPSFRSTATRPARERSAAERSTRPRRRRTSHRRSRSTRPSTG